MGSSLSESQSLLLALACGALFLLFDTARSLALQLGPMRLRRLSAEPRNRLFHYTPHNFSLITGTMVQLWLVLGVAFTALALRDAGLFGSILIAALVWIVFLSVLKFGLGFLPDEYAGTAIQAIVPVTHVFYYLLWPIMFPLRWVSERTNSRREEDDEEEQATDEEVQAFIDVGEEEGILEAEDAELIQSVVDFGDKLVHEVMTPRIDMVAFDARRPIHDLARMFVDSKYSRIPVYEQNIDDITGIVHVKDLFEAIFLGQDREASSLARPAHKVPETRKVSALLRELQLGHLQVAIVLDEYGGTAGIVTIEDVVEEIVGEIADEHEDEEETTTPLEGGGYLVPGMLRVEELEDLTGAGLQGEDYETVAGLIFTQLGRVPKVGERVQKNGLTFEVDRADRKRIYRVRVTPVHEAATQPAGDRGA